MGNGGIYAKRKKREKPKSPRERNYEYQTSSGSSKTENKYTDYEVDRYIRKGSKQKGMDSSLNTTGRKKWERERSGNPKKGE